MFLLLLLLCCAGVPDLRGAADGDGERAAAGRELEARAVVRPPARFQGDY